MASARKLLLLVCILGLSVGRGLGVAGDLYSYSVQLGDAQTAYVNAVIFDGHYMWAAVQDASGHGAIEKLDTTGAVLARAAVGSIPIELAYDGKNIWVTDYASSDVSVVNGANGALAKKIQLASNANPEGILFDGRYIWVANNGVGANNVSKFDPTSMKLLASYPLGSNPDGLAFDGSMIWITNSNDDNLVRIDRRTGLVQRMYPTGAFPLSILYDGKNMWVGSGPIRNGSPLSVPGYLLKFRAYGGVKLGTFPVGRGVRGLASDGTSIWACNSTDNSFSRVRSADGAPLGTFPAGKAPRSMAFDGVQMWIANSAASILTVVTPRADPVQLVSGTVRPQLLLPLADNLNASSSSSSQTPPSAGVLSGMLSVLLDDD